MASKDGSQGLPDWLKLVIGAGGIYGAFMYYGLLQEDVFKYVAEDGTKFKAAWLLQALEAFANVGLGGLGLLVFGAAKGVPQDMFALTGACQVCAKAFTSLALASGVSFPVVTLAKSGKMVPVMVGSLVLGGASYSLREYLSVGAIIAGTCIVSMGKKSSGQASSTLGLLFIVASLACDGLVGGIQSRLKNKCAASNVKPGPYDFMFWTNLYMALTATLFAFALGEASTGIGYLMANPPILKKVLMFSLCSALGQSFIFFILTNFDSLVCTTVTTTRKIFSVLLSIFQNGHPMNEMGWFGIGLASVGILSEVFGKGHKKEAPKKKE